MQFLLAQPEVLLPPNHLLGATSRSSSPSPTTPTFPAHSPRPTVVIDVCNEVAESVSVATNSVDNACPDSTAPTALVADSDHITCTTPVIVHITAPLPTDLSRSNSTPPSSIPAVADTCNEAAGSSFVTTNSVVNARLEPTVSAALIEDSTMTHTHTPTLATTVINTAATATRPATRSTATPIHPFFIELTNRTGKAAKHFRRLYPPTVAMCECNLFPVYSQQIRSPTSDPVEPLPAPLQLLCLNGIHEIVEQYRNRCTEKAPQSGAKPPYWTRVHVPGLLWEMWTESMHDTFTTIYWSYHTNQRLIAESARAPHATSQRPVTRSCVANSNVGLSVWPWTKC